MIKKPCCSRFLLHKFIQLKYFWTQFKNVHLQGPCSLRLCISKPYCMPKLDKVGKIGQLKNLYAYISAIQSIRVTYFCHHTSPKRTTTYLNWMQMEQIEAKMCTVCGLLGKIRTHSTLFQKEGGGLCYGYVDTLTIIQGHLLFEIWALSFYQVEP